MTSEVIGSNLKVREDLNKILISAKFKKIESKYGVRYVNNVTLFNGEVIEFKDSDGVCELFNSYVKAGEKEFIASVQLVDELTKATEDKESKVYTCLKYTLKDGSEYRLFPTKFISNKIIDNYYNLFKKQEKNNK